MAAIYCPPCPKDLEVKSTLYPVDVAESLEYFMQLQSGRMDLILTIAEVTVKGVLTKPGTYEQLRWFFEETIPSIEEVTAKAAVHIGTYTQLRWFLEETIPSIEEVTVKAAMTKAGVYTSKLVIADSPDEELQLNANIFTSSMDAI